MSVRTSITLRTCAPTHCSDTARHLPKVAHHPEDPRVGPISPIGMPLGREPGQAAADVPTRSGFDYRVRPALLCHSGSVLEPKQVAQAYARWIADGEPEFQAMMSPDLHDHVSGRRGPETWDMVWGWIEASFDQRRA